MHKYVCLCDCVCEWRAGDGGDFHEQSRCSTLNDTRFWLVGFPLHYFLSYSHHLCVLARSENLLMLLNYILKYFDKIRLSRISILIILFLLQLT